MFEKILIANRGDNGQRVIAAKPDCRVIVTAKKMSIGTVAVYPQAGRSVRYVSPADETVLRGLALSRGSYLLAYKIVAGARRFIDDVVLPHETHKRICGSLAMLEDKKFDNPWRKHGNIPL